MTEKKNSITKKVTRVLYFPYLGGSPRWADSTLKLRGGWPPRRNHVKTVFVAQCGRLERAVAVRLSDHRSVDRRARPLLRSTALPRPGVGHQQIHQETARSQRHRQQRAA